MGGISSEVGKKFKVKVLFITSSKVICEVVDGFKGKKSQQVVENEISDYNKCDNKSEVKMGGSE